MKRLHLGKAILVMLLLNSQAALSAEMNNKVHASWDTITLLPAILAGKFPNIKVDRKQPSAILDAINQVNDQQQNAKFLFTVTLVDGAYVVKQKQGASGIDDYSAYFLAIAKQMSLEPENANLRTFLRKVFHDQDMLEYYEFLNFYWKIEDAENEITFQKQFCSFAEKYRSSFCLNRVDEFSHNFNSLAEDQWPDLKRLLIFLGVLPLPADENEADGYQVFPVKQSNLMQLIKSMLPGKNGAAITPEIRYEQFKTILEEISKSVTMEYFEFLNFYREITSTENETKLKGQFCIFVEKYGENFCASQAAQLKLRNKFSHNFNSLAEDQWPDLKRLLIFLGVLPLPTENIEEACQQVVHVKLDYLIPLIKSMLLDKNGNTMLPGNSYENFKTTLNVIVTEFVVKVLRDQGFFVRYSQFILNSCLTDPNNSKNRNCILQ
jgi:hypothetical protein